MLPYVHLVFALIEFSQPAAPTFAAQVIDDRIAIGYGLAIGDVDGDGKPDILLADKKQFVWYRNGDWKRFVMIEDLTVSDNVCIAARDIDGDGKVEVAVGAQWNPSETTDTAVSGSVHFLIRPKDPTQRWTPVKLHHEPTVHRMKWVRATENKFLLVVLPLHGRGNKNGEGAPVKVIAYQKPSNPLNKWTTTIVDESMHQTHNFDVVPDTGAAEMILIAGKEGVRGFKLSEQRWIQIPRAGSKDKAGYQLSGKSLGEVRALIINGKQRIAGVAPMHGNELVVHDSAGWNVLTSDLSQGHAMATGDFLSSGNEQIVVGWREPNKENKVGIKMFVPDRKGVAWKEYWIDNDGMACEDLQAADLNGDGKKDIIAAGRNSHNLKIYWNYTAR
jgi:hypothetical protein